MKNDSFDPLPKTLAGAVCKQWVRCGRRGCRCARGQLHGPYFYRFWRQGGRLVKTYVPRREVDRVRAEYETCRQLRKAMAMAWQEWRRMVLVIKEAEKT